MTGKQSSAIMTTKSISDIFGMQITIHISNEGKISVKELVLILIYQLMYNPHNFEILTSDSHSEKI